MRKNEVPNCFDLTGQTIVITGGSGKLGTQYALSLSSMGADVVLTDIHISTSKKTVKDIQRKFKTNPSYFHMDLSNEKSISQTVSKIIKKYKKVDTLINNAIFEPHTSNYHSSLKTFKISSWNKVLDVNLTGTFLCCKYFGEYMEKQGSGNIINISSIYGLVGADQRIYGKSKINSSPAYAASKSAILNLTRYLASYWQKKNIRVNTLTLGGVYSNQPKEFVKNYSNRTMLGRMANSNEYNGAVIFLCSNSSSYMTGSNLVIDGGWTAW